MSNSFFRFKQFTVHHDRCAMKVTTDSCFFGAWAAKEMKNSKTLMKEVLDIGAGTGLLSLMVAQKNQVEIEAIEVEKEASVQATENINASPWKDRIHIINKDIRSFNPQKKYDVIISNPPFYENELTSETQNKNIAHHSKQLTFAELIKLIKTHLKEDGLFFLLFPYKRKDEVERLLQQNELFVSTSVVLHQSVKHPPFRVMVKGSDKKFQPEKSISIYVWNEHQQYTEAFIELLKDYYLYL